MVLTSSPQVRADLIGQCFRREEYRLLGELLLECETNDFARAAVVAVLREDRAKHSP